MLSLAYINICLLGLEVGFISDEHNRNLVVGVAFCLVQPLGHIIERVSVGDVVNQNHPDGPPIVRSRDGLEGLLPGGIPDLQFYLFVLNSDDFGPEFYTNGGVVIELKFLLEELQEETGLAYRGVPNDDVLEEVRVARHKLL